MAGSTSKMDCDDSDTDFTSSDESESESEFSSDSGESESSDITEDGVEDIDFDMPWTENGIPRPAY